MKYIVIFLGLMCTPVLAEMAPLDLLIVEPIASESLCGVTDETAVLRAISGVWYSDGGTSVESETLSVIEVQKSSAAIYPQGNFSFDLDMSAQGPNVLAAGGVVYNVDQIDDILETVEAEWIADAVSLTPCGPEDLLQLSMQLKLDPNPSGPNSTGTVTLIPYFNDKVLMISEVEMRGEWGLAFMTMAALLTPAERF